MFIGSTETRYDRTHEAIVGEVFMVTDMAIWQDLLLPELRKVQEALHDSAQSLPDGLTASSSPSLQSLKLKLAANASFMSTVDIERTGITTLTVDGAGNAITATPKLPEDPIPKARMLQSLAAQLFFFLKDIGHVHQHHHGETDTIVDIYLVEQDDDDWQQNTLYALYRKIIAFKRDRHDQNFVNSLGVLAYAETFDKIRQLDPKDEKFFYDGVRESVESGRAKLMSQQEKSEKRRNLRDFYFFSVFGLVVSIASLAQLDSKDMPVDLRLLGVVTLIVAHPVYALIIMGLVYFGIWGLFEKLPTYLSMKRKSLLALLHSFSQTSVGLTAILLGIFIVGFAIGVRF